jgi:hypothetical protein
MRQKIWFNKVYVQIRGWCRVPPTTLQIRAAILEGTL